MQTMEVKLKFCIIVTVYI